MCRHYFRVKHNDSASIVSVSDRFPADAARKIAFRFIHQRPEKDNAELGSVSALPVTSIGDGAADFALTLKK